MIALCREIEDRSVGSAGNRRATGYFNTVASSFGWHTDCFPLDVVDWSDGGASLQAEGKSFQVHVSPYSKGCDAAAELVCVSTLEELEERDVSGKILLLHGDIACEQIMPKNFVFYNPPDHRKTVSLLEQKKPSAIVSATGRNSGLAGGVYPFPLFEDGDFDIPSVYMTEEEGKLLIPLAGNTASIHSTSKRIPAKAYNIVASKGTRFTDRIAVTAHIDAKKGTPGAIDNATGVTVLLLLAELLWDYSGIQTIELAPLNGEDYYSVPGQMDFLARNSGIFNSIALNINIDGAGYIKGKTAFSSFGLPEHIGERTGRIISEYNGITEGIQWPQGDHSIFIQQGCPALAVSSEWFINNIETQDITHTPKDNLNITDCRKVVEIAEALKKLICGISQ